MRQLCVSCTIFLSIVSFASAKIVWISHWDIFTMDDDGSNVQRLTFDNVYDTSPRWSPDGKYIAFEREQKRKTNEQNHDLFLMKTNGKQIRQLTTYNGLDLQPSWSPDSKYLLFTSTRSRDATLHIMDVETQEVRQLPRNIDGSPSQFGTWSVDGKIAYLSSKFRPFGETIYIADANGRNPMQLFPHIGADHHSLRWSPDGKQLLYGRSKYENNRLISDKILIRTKEGRLVKEIEMPDINRWVVNSACWMGTKDLLLDVTKNYKAHNGGQTDIYRYTIATGEMINLTRTPSDNDYSPDWIDDAALDVSPTAEKLPILWGQLKQTD